MRRGDTPALPGFIRKGITPYFELDPKSAAHQIVESTSVGNFRTLIGMSDLFENVSLVKKANVYFGGRVTSREVRFADGSRKTLGFMQAGDYEFGTEAPELMEVIGGSMEVKLPGCTDWRTVAEGASFEVEGNSKFSLKVPEGGADYCCSYL